MKIIFIFFFSDCPLHFSFTLLQIGALFLWSYVYNIVRISSSKALRIDNVDNLTSCVKSTGGTADLLQGRRTSLTLIPPKERSISPEHAYEPLLPFTGTNNEEEKVAFTFLAYTDNKQITERADYVVQIIA